MKKLTFVAGMAIAAVALVSCDGGAPKASLKSDIDTLTYAIGVANSPYMKQMIQDTAYTAEFIKGIKDAGFKVKIRAYRELSNDIVRSGKTVTKKFTIYGNWCGTKCFVPQCNVSYKYDADGYMNISFDPIANASAYTVYVAYSNDYSHYYKLVTLDYDQTSVSSDLIDKGDRIIVLPTVRINDQSYAARIFDKAYYKNYDYCIVK